MEERAAKNLPGIGMFFNRLVKNARHWGRWARRRGISCYRVYDRDIPEFPFALDVYAQHAHLQEYRRAREGGDALRAAWLQEVRRAAAEALGLLPGNVVLKQRSLRHAGEQHEKTGDPGEDFVVEEGGHRFLVNLGAYLDTGLFLDHRNTRAMIGQRARGKRFLNLFCYTGSFTVYAAAGADTLPVGANSFAHGRMNPALPDVSGSAGGAASSLSVDLSNTYLDWARRNFELNGMDLQRHRLLRADVLGFLREARAGADTLAVGANSFAHGRMNPALQTVSGSAGADTLPRSGSLRGAPAADPSRTRPSATVSGSAGALAVGANSFAHGRMNPALQTVSGSDGRGHVTAQRQPAGTEHYDLIVLDPPSFSASKKMQGVLDVQRDHVELIENCLALLAPQGELFFSTNLRSFRLDTQALAPCSIEEISHLTVPEDFRNKKIHRCWLIRSLPG